MSRTHQTQWAAQFAVASELCKRGYEVALTMGNHPSVDLMVRSPRGVSFSVDVKGLYKPNFWVVKAKPDYTSLFYVLAFVPEDTANRFFVLTQVQMNREIRDNSAQVMSRAKEKGRKIDVNRFPGIRWGKASAFEEKWDVLPR